MPEPDSCKKEKLELMSLDVILKRYDKMENLGLRSKVRITHDYYYCFYWSESNRCKAEKNCPQKKNNEKLA